MSERMKVVIDIPNSLLEQVRQAIQHGDYDDAREFVTVAVENQLELESTEQAEEVVMTLGQAMKAEEKQPRTDGSSPEELQQTRSSQGSATLTRSEYDEVTTVSFPDSDRLADGPLWGQYNRIFPVKLAVRILANDLRTHATQASSQVNGTGDKLVSLDHFNKQASEIAREYGLKIQHVDTERSRGQGEKLSAALPVGDNPQKSCERFQTHFIGYAEQAGTLTGAAPNLLFTNIPINSSSAIGLTEAGLEFAELWNPLIDGGVSSDQSLSDEECTFYLSHIRNYLPKEFDAMQFTAEAITEGDNRPESLSSRVATLNDTWSEAQASTVRSGLVSRMYELKLVERERVGQRGIAYTLTDDGFNFLNSNT